MYVESEDQAKSEIPSEWPVKLNNLVKVSEDQTMRVLSRDAEAKSLPFFENFTQETARVWFVRIFFRLYGWYACVGLPLFAIAVET